MKKLFTLLPCLCLLLFAASARADAANSSRQRQGSRVNSFFMTAIHRVRLESSTICDLHCDYRESSERANTLADLHRAAAGRRLTDAVLRKLVWRAATYHRLFHVFERGAN